MNWEGVDAISDGVFGSACGQTPVGQRNPLQTINTSRQEMANRPIEVNGKPLSVHKATVDPVFSAKTVLASDAWDYIDLWLRRSHEEEARFFWEQARQFAAATRELPKESSPLTAYYCMLNCAKALLLVKKQAFTDQHGITGSSTGSKCHIKNEQVVFKSSGILPGLCRWLGEVANGETYTLCDILYNLVYIHRAFNLSLPSRPELFVPIKQPRIVRSMKTDEAWFCTDLERAYASLNTVNRLDPGFERDLGIPDTFTVRSKKRFKWSSNKKAESLQRYVVYHQSIRRHLAYIKGDSRLWYIKRGDGPDGYIPRSSLTLSFAAMHRLSELARYAPDRLAGHFEGRYNWLLSDFIATAPTQFVDNISSEMTGFEFMPPQRAS